MIYCHQTLGLPSVDISDSEMFCFDIESSVGAQICESIDTSMVIMDDEIDTGDKEYIIRVVAPDPLPAGLPSVSFSDPPGSYVPLYVNDDDISKWRVWRVGS